MRNNGPETISLREQRPPERRERESEESRLLASQLAQNSRLTLKMISSYSSRGPVKARMAIGWTAVSPKNIPAMPVKISVSVSPMRLPVTSSMRPPKATAGATKVMYRKMMDRKTCGWSRLP